MSVIKYFRIDELKAKQIVREVRAAAQKWRVHAQDMGIEKINQDLMARAFRLAES
jgi:hypothetical protein